MAINWKQVRTAAKRQDQQQIRGRTAAGVSAPQAQTQISAQGRIDWDAVKGNAQLLDQQQAQSRQRENAYEEAYQQYKQYVAEYQKQTEFPRRVSVGTAAQQAGGSQKRDYSRMLGLNQLDGDMQPRVQAAQDIQKYLQFQRKVQTGTAAQQAATNAGQDYSRLIGLNQFDGELERRAAEWQRKRQAAQEAAALDQERGRRRTSEEYGKRIDALEAASDYARAQNAEGGGLPEFKDAYDKVNAGRETPMTLDEMQKELAYTRYKKAVLDKSVSGRVGEYAGDLATQFISGGADMALGGLGMVLGYLEQGANGAAAWVLRDLAKAVPDGSIKDKMLSLADDFSSYYTGESMTAGEETARYYRDELNRIGDEIEGKYKGVPLWIQQQMPSAGNMLFGAGLSGIAGVNNLVTLGLTSGGNSALEAKDKGASDAQALAYGVVAGGLEVFSERLFGGNPIYDADAGLINQAVGKLTSNKTIMKILNSKAFDIASEGLEEVVTEVLDPVAEWAIYNGDNTEFADAASIGNAFLGGVFLSAIGNVADAPKQLQQARYERVLRTAGSELADIAQSVDSADVQEAAQVIRDKIAYGVTPDAADIGAVLDAMDQAGETVDVEQVREAVDAEENEAKAAQAEAAFQTYNQYADERDAKARDAEKASWARSQENTEAINDAEADSAADAFEKLNEAEVKGAADARARQQTEEARAERTFTQESREDADRLLTDAARRYGFDDRMTSVLLSGYDGAQDAQQYAEDVNAAYEYGRNGMSLSAAQRAAQGVNADVAQEAWNAGRASIQRATMSDVERYNRGALGDGMTRAAWSAGKGFINGEEAGSTAADESGKRNAGMDSGKPVGAVAEGTGGAKTRPAKASAVAERIELENRVRAAGQPYLSGKDIGLEKGSAQRSFREAPESTWTDSMKAAAAMLRGEGFKEVHFTVGAISVENQRAKVTRYADGVVTGNTVWINATSKKWTVEQLANHEAFHHQIQDWPYAMDAVRQALADELGEDGIQELAQRYAEAYEGCYDGAELDAYIEEICADAYAGMDRLPEEKARIVQQAAQRRLEAQSAEKSGETRGPPEKYSYAGELARTADKETLERAKQMLEGGASAEDIFRETGWFKGADGQWRFEIDDSKMEFRRDGDVRLMEEAPYRRMQELSDKWAASFEKGGEELTEAESTELEALQDQYVDRVWEEKYELQDFLKHDELYKAYPKLRHMSLIFRPMSIEDYGYYSPKDGTIVMNSDLIGAPEKTLIHEIQHIIQSMEGFARGASPKYWNDRMEDGFSKKNAAGEEMLPNELYRNTAGEIEARDVAERRGLSAEERRNRMPDTGNADTVFAEGDGYFSMSVKTAADGAPYVLVENKMTKAQLSNYQTVADYIAEHIGEAYTILESGQKVYIGKDLPNEYTQSQYTKRILQTSKLTAKNKAVSNLGEMIEIASNRRWEKTRHAGNKDAPYGMYRYDTTFAFPVQGGARYKAFDAELVIRNASDGKKYLYDIVSIKENTGLALDLNNKARGRRGSGATRSDVSMDSIRSSERKSQEKFSAAEDAQEATAEAAKEPPMVYESLTMDSIPKKAQDYLRRVRGQTAAAIQQTLSMPFAARQEVLKPAIEEMMNEYLQTGRISQETVDRSFEESYRRGVEMDTEFYDQYKDVKTRLRDLKVTLSEADRADIADFDDFRRAASGRLRIANEGGLPVDVAYKEMQQMAPELFPESITHPADQLMRMFEVSKRIEKVQMSLDEYHGEDAEEFKRWAKNDYEASVENMLGALNVARRYAEARMRQQQARAVPTTMEEVKSLYADLKGLRRTYERAAAKNLLTAEDNSVLNRLLRGEITPEDVQGMENAQGILAMYEAKADYDAAAAKIADWRRYRKGKLREQADNLLKNSEKAKDKKAGIEYSRETMTRNVRDIFPEADAEAINKTYFEPVRTASANANKLKNQLREQVKALDLSRKARKGDAVSEAHAVQLLGEAQDNIRYLEQHPRAQDRDGKTLNEWRQIVLDLWATSPGLDRAKIENAVETFRKIYDGLFEQMNDVRIRNGYEPINYRQGYFPHFQPGTTDGILGLMGKALGIDAEVTALPTTISGLTHTFKPGITYFGNALERIGFDTAYDAVEGFDKYVEGAASVICYTDAIQNLRALAQQVRYRTSDEGLRERVDDIRARDDLTEHQKELEIKEIMDKGQFSLSNFAVELDEYTNLLANKKSKYDRSMEHLGGRKLYNFMRAWQNRVAANMVAVNPASWLTNFGVITQAGAQLKTISVLKGMWQTLANIKTNDGLVEASDFLTNRAGSDPLVRTWQQSASAFLSTPMEWIDQFSAGTIVRARYMENIERGMSEETAMREADDFAANVMADRSKGAMPTLFEARNPLMKMFTQFQLEVNNTYSYLFKDLPREQRKKGVRYLALALFKFLIGGFLYNELYEYLIGRRPMLDPLGIVNDTVGDLTGYELNNLVDTAAVGGLIKESEPESAVGTIQNLAENVGQEAPFIGNLMGGGKLPFSSSMPNVKNILTALDSETATDKEKLAKVGKEMVNPAAYWLLPFGGGQIKKMWQGISALKRQGSYTANGRLQYPIYTDRKGDKANAAWRTLLFGKSATPEAQAWVEAGFGALSEKETQTYEAMRAGGVDQRDSYELIKAMSKVKKTDTQTKEQLQMQLLNAFDIEDSGKVLYYYNMMASDKERAQIDKLLAEGADMGEYLRYLQEKSGVTGEKDADGKTISGSVKEETFALIDGLNLTPEQKTELAKEDYTPTGFEPWTENHDRLYKAVSTGKDLRSTLKGLEKDGYEPKEIRAAITDMFRDEYLAADKAGKARLKGYLRNAFMVSGLSQKEAENKIKKWEEAQK